MANNKLNNIIALKNDNKESRNKIILIHNELKEILKNYISDKKKGQ